MACAQGALSRFWVKDGAGTPTWTTGTVHGYEFLAENLRKIGSIVHPNGIRGTRSRTSERARLGPYRVMGTVLMNIDPRHLNFWLPRMLGAAEASDVFDLSEGLSPFACLFDRVTSNFEYRDCYVNRWVLRGQANQFGGQPQPLQLAVELIGKTQASGVTGPDSSAMGTPTETLASSNETYIAKGALPVTSNTAPYIFEDLVLTLNSVARPVLAFEFSGNNFLQVRFTNSLTATDICPQDRQIELNMTLPYTSDTSALLDLTIAGVTGTFVLTNSTISKSMTATFGNVKIPTLDPTVRGKQEIMLELSADIYKVALTPELSITSTS